MKKLIFIDNDDIKRANKDVDYVKNNLEYIAKVPAKMIENIEIVPDFSRMSKEDIYNLVFDENNVICSWSMYTANHYGSLGQMTHLLAAAGRDNIVDKTFIDGSGMILKALNRSIRDMKHGHSVVDIFRCIKTNFIISFDTDNNVCGRVYAAFQDSYNTFDLSEIDVTDLIS